MNRCTILSRLLSVVFLLTIAVSSTAFAADRLPNFVIVYIDDMGYGDIGPFGAEGYETPNLDRMAEEGRRFTDFYVTQAVCSASRAGLMTGCYNVRVGILGALNHRANHGISSDEMTNRGRRQAEGLCDSVFWEMAPGSPSKVPADKPRL